MNKKDTMTVILGVVRFLFLSVLAAGLIFLSSWDVLWPGPWIVLAFNVLYSLFTLTVGLKYFPETVLLRAKTKFRYSWDRQALVIFGFFHYSQYLIGGLDHRFSWSQLPAPVIAAGIAIYAVGMAVTVWVIAVNPFAIGSARLQKKRHHKLVTRGPYRFLRHPMYSSAILFAVGIPLILGSLWALIPAPIAIAAMMYRCVNEDRLLMTKLKGYAAFSKKVRHRMIPFIW